MRKIEEQTEQKGESSSEKQRTVGGREEQWKATRLRPMERGGGSEA